VKCLKKGKEIYIVVVHVNIGVNNFTFLVFCFCSQVSPRSETSFRPKHCQVTHFSGQGKLESFFNPFLIQYQEESVVNCNTLRDDWKYDSKVMKSVSLEFPIQHLVLS